MNYLNQVAEMLGVELEEEFELKKGIDDLYRFKLSRIGLVYFSPSTQMWHEGNRLLVDLLLGKDEIEKHILDEKEKEYLSGVIRPFRDKVQYITKIRYCTSDEIFIGYKGSSDDVSISNIVLPYFDSETMYKGMKAGKDYTLEELGL